MNCVHSVQYVAAVGLQQHDGADRGLPGLHQRQQLEPLVHRAEAAGQQHERVGLLHERDLAREEVLEVDQLGVAGDEPVGALLRRQLDAHAEAVRCARALVPRRHDPRTRARDHHPAAVRHRRANSTATAYSACFCRRAGRAEDAHLPAVAVRGEDAKGAPELAERAADQLHLAAVGAARGAERRLDDVLENVSVGHAGGLYQRADLVVEVAVAGTRAAAHPLPARARANRSRLERLDAGDDGRGEIGLHRGFGFHRLILAAADLRS